MATSLTATKVTQNEGGTPIGTDDTGAGLTSPTGGALPAAAAAPPAAPVDDGTAAPRATMSIETPNAINEATGQPITPPASSSVDTSVDTTGAAPAGSLDTTGANTGALASAAALGPANYDPNALAAASGTQKDATTYTPTSDALVSANLNKLISGDSDYMQLARTKAAQYANSRGLLNSSIGAGAGASAAIEAALPIAQGDANVNATAQSQNAQAQNTFDLDANQFGRQGALAAQAAGYTENQNAQNEQWQGTQNDADRAIKDSEFQASNANAVQQTANDYAVKSVSLTQDLEKTYLDARTQLETSPNLDQDAKATAIGAMADWFYGSALPDIMQQFSSPGQWPDLPAPGTPAAPGAAPAKGSDRDPGSKAPAGSSSASNNPGDPNYNPTTGSSYNDSANGGGGG